MKKLILFLLTTIGSAAGLMSFSNVATQDKFYYAFNERVPLRMVENKLIVRYERVANRAQVAASASYTQAPGPASRAPYNTLSAAGRLLRTHLRQALHAPQTGLISLSQ